MYGHKESCELAVTYILPSTAGPGGVAGYSARAPLPRMFVTSSTNSISLSRWIIIIKYVAFRAADGIPEPLQIAGILRLSDCGVL